MLFPEKYTKEQLKQMIKEDSLPPALKETHSEAKDIVHIMMSDILRSHKEYLRKGA